MTRRRATILAMVGLICMVALVLRLPQLSLRPMHTDEAVQAARFADMMAGTYQYDPTEYHGPALYVFAWPIAALQGKTKLEALSEADLRIVPVLLGMATLVLLFLLRDALGTPALVMAAIFVAVSPAFSYYNRYFIHESLLVFLTLATIVALWRYRQRPGFGWAIAAGAAAGLLYATKTTWIIAAACALLAWGLTMLWQRHFPPPPRHHHHAKEEVPRQGSIWHAAAGLAVALVIVILLFTSFFANPRGLVDSLTAFQAYLGRGLGGNADAANHVHPWYYHLQTLLYVHGAHSPIWTQAFIVLLALPAIAVTFRRNVHGVRLGALRFLAIFTILLWTAYSLIPYKTPWLILTPLLGLTLLAGVGAVVLWQYASRWHLRIVLVALLAAGTADLEWQAYAANFLFPASPVNPYVYAHTSRDVFTLLARVESIAAVAPEHRQMAIAMLTDHCWPLPWYLRQYPHLDWWDGVPDARLKTDPPMIIAPPQMAEAIEKRFPSDYRQEFFELRPHGVFMMVYTRDDLWQRLLAARAGRPPQN